MIQKLYTIGLSLVVCLGLLVGMWPKQQAFAECEDPDTLTYAAMSQERAPVVAKRIEPLLEYLEEVTGKKVEIYLTTSYAAQIEAMLGGFADIANFGPFAYVLATEKAPNIEAFATYANKGMPEHFIPGGPAYIGLLVTKKGGEFDTIESLEGKVCAFPDPGSTSGWLLPNVLFTKEKLDGESLKSYFEETIFTGSHDSSLLALVEGRVDAAFTWDSAPYRLWKRGEISKPAEAFEVLWESPMIPLDPYSYRSELCPELQKNIKKAFLTWHEQPQSKDFFEAIGGVKFVEMQDSDYDVIRELHEAKKKQDD